MSGIVWVAFFAIHAHRRFAADGPFATALVAFSPMALALSYSGHPQLVAGALFFIGIVVADHSAPPRALSGYLREALASLLWALALSVRADAGLGAVWLVALAWPGPAAGRTSRLLRRACTVALAIAMFSVAQNRLIQHSTGTQELALFLEMFLGYATYTRAAFIFAFSIGLVTVGVSIWGVVRGFKTPKLRGRLLTALLLLVPTLAFWVTVPAPSRHFFYALIGVAEVALLAVAGRRLRWVAWSVVGVVVGNFVLAEALHDQVASRYSWTYSSLTPRRATGAVPLGLPFPDRTALLTLHRALREEGQRVSAYRDRDLVIFGDESPTLVMGFLERGDVSVWSDTTFGDVQAEHLIRDGQNIYIVPKASYRPRDVEAEFIAKDPLPEAVYYTQPFTLTPYDVQRGLLPNRRLQLPPNGTQ